MVRVPSTMVALGTRAPDFTLPDPATGRSVGLRDLRDAPALLVIFLSNHCPYVKHIADELSAFAREYTENGLAIVAIWISTLVTAITGLVLWFENFTLTWLPGWVPEAATVLHFLEAILATLAILIWHFYFVIFDPAVYPMDTTWLTGKPPFARAEERGEVIYTGEAVDRNA